MASKPNRSRRAFTLYELVVVIALFALVGGMVTSFIIFMSNYSNTSERQAQRVSDLTEIRAQTDKWFSYADASGIAVTFGDGGNAVARAGDMSITVSQQEDGCTFVFNYGTSESGRTQTLTFENIYTMRIFAEGTAADENSDALIRFTVQMRVQNVVCACEIYAGAE